MSNVIQCDICNKHFFQEPKQKILNIFNNTLLRLISKKISACRPEYKIA